MKEESLPTADFTLEESSRSCVWSTPQRITRILETLIIWGSAKHCSQVASRLRLLEGLRAVVTQNIDGLHQAAGSKRVLSSTATRRVFIVPVRPHLHA